MSVGLDQASAPRPSQQRERGDLLAGFTALSSPTTATAPSTKTPSPGRGSIKNLFTSDSTRTTASAKYAEGRSSLNLAPYQSPLSPISRNKTNLASNEGPWSVSVAEAAEERKPRKRGKPKSLASTPQSYTLYITTPTHNVTLQRTVIEITELDGKLRAAGHNTLPQLPKLAHSSIASSLPASPSSIHGGGGSRRLFQTISRTLSPGGTRNRANLKQITKSLAAGSAPPSATTPASAADATPDSAATGDVPTMPATPISAPSHQPAGNGKITTGLVTYFTTLANLPTIKSSKPWRDFTRVRTDDLESQRVERRVHRVRSDLASHIKSAVAPINVNVGEESIGRRQQQQQLHNGSQSDLGEDVGGRGTEEERDNASINGRSTSRQLRNATSSAQQAHPTVKAVRSASDRSSGGEDEAMAASPLVGKKGSPNFANIPEESEKEKEVVATSQQHLTVESSQGGTSGESLRADSSLADSRGEITDGGKFTGRKRRSDRSRSEKVTVDDFEMIRVLGKGCAGKVLLVRHKATTGLFAMKSIHKRHVLAHQELQHTLTEQAVLKRMAREATDPFCVKLWWSFHDKQNLYLVMDFHPGGDLATQLSRWGRLGRDRARFYAAEIVEGVEGLHKAGVIYRDLKPENVLIAADGHIVLSDFGLSKEFPDRRADGPLERGCTTPPPSSQARASSSRDVTTAAAMGIRATSSGSPKPRRPPWVSASEDGASGPPASQREERDTTTTFCGTAEYLAPEVIQGAAYSYEVDWWSFGTMLYEFLVGVTPFWADTHADMYIRVLHDELAFPEDRVLDSDTKGILRGLLQRNPMLRMKEPRIKKHPYFSMIEWDHVFHKRYIPPYVPPINPLDDTDTQNFDEAFLDMQPVVQDEGDDAEDIDGEAKPDEDDDADAATQVGHTNDDLVGERRDDPVGGKDANVEKGTSAIKTEDPLAKSLAADGKSLFDGYSFRGRKDSGSIHSSFRSQSLESDSAASEVLDADADADIGVASTLNSGPTTTSNVGDNLEVGRLTTPTPAESSADREEPSTTRTDAHAGTVRPTTLLRSSSTVKPAPTLPQSPTSSLPSPSSPLFQGPAPVVQSTIISPPSPPSETKATPPPPPLIQPIPQRPRKEETVVTKVVRQGQNGETGEDSEDDESAARAAVLALAILEREADMDEEDTPLDPVDPPITTDNNNNNNATSTSRPNGISGLPATQDPIVEDADDEDDGEEEDDWDLIDSNAFSSENRGNGLPSDTNGGKGQNLFARGVVDTYRLLRRQDSTRLSDRIGGGIQGGGGGMSGAPSRPFSRLGARRKAAAAAAAAQAQAEAQMSGSKKPSKADLRAGSVISLDSTGNVNSTHQGDLTPVAAGVGSNNNVKAGGGNKTSAGEADGATTTTTAATATATVPAESAPHDPSATAVQQQHAEEAEEVVETLRSEGDHEDSPGGPPPPVHASTKPSPGGASGASSSNVTTPSPAGVASSTGAGPNYRSAPNGSSSSSSVHHTNGPPPSSSSTSTSTSIANGATTNTLGGDVKRQSKIRRRFTTFFDLAAK